MAVFVHICDLMFLDDSSFHYEPYYEVGAVLVVLSLESCSLHRTPLLKRSLVYYSLYRCLFDSFIPGFASGSPPPGNKEGFPLCRVGWMGTRSRQ